MYHETDEFKDWVMQASGENETEYTVNGFSSNQWKMLIGDSSKYNFGVSKDGSLYASNASLSGKLTATTHENEESDTGSKIIIYSNRIYFKSLINNTKEQTIGSIYSTQGINDVGAVRKFHIGLAPDSNSTHSNVLEIGYGGVGITVSNSPYIRLIYDVNTDGITETVNAYGILRGKWYANEQEDYNKYLTQREIVSLIHEIIGDN